MHVAVQYCCLVQFLGACNGQTIVGLLIHKFLWCSLSLSSGLGCLEALQAGVVDLDLFQDVTLSRLRRRSGGLRLRRGLRRALAQRSGGPHGLDLLLLLGRLLPHDLFHVVHFGLLVLIGEVATSAAVVINDEFVASSVNLGNHLVLLRCLWSRMSATTSADRTCGLVGGLILPGPRLLVGGRGHLQDVNVLRLGGTANTRPARGQGSNCLTADHPIRVARHVDVARVAHLGACRPLWRCAASPSILAVLVEGPVLNRLRLLLLHLLGV